jgi:hypothetical protein
MTVVHLVLFKLKEDATEEQISALVDGLQSLSSLPGVEKITAGANPPMHSSSSQRVEP